jgi:general secretion pathway protein E
VKNLDTVLIDHGVSVEDIEKAKAYQERAGGVLEKVLLNMGSFSEEIMPSIYAQLLDVDLLDNERRDDWTPPDGSNLIPSKFFFDNGWLLFGIDESQHLLFVSHRPTNWNVRQYLNHEGIKFSLIVCSESDFSALSLKLDHSESESLDDDDSLSDLEEERLREMASEAPTVNLLNSLITKALRMNASDMHVEPKASRYRVRFRIDGVLHDIDLLPKRLELPIISRLKILSGMDIAEKRRPQDGKVEMRIANINLDIRVSSLPVNHGESVVLRFLRKDTLQYDLATLGIASDVQTLIQQDLTKTSGVVLLTGPTGSGKTTTLYSFLNSLNTDDVKIVTLEDPVEYQLPGLNQVQVRPEIGFDFSAGLRSVVRQDPDVIMVGEIRDRVTCQIAMQAALTGHLVFSTVHTNDAPSAYTRLLDLGVEEFLLDAALVSIIAQRLVRKLCDKCSAPVSDGSRLINQYKLEDLAERAGVQDIDLRGPVGCEHCGGSGFTGRVAVIQYLRCDESIRSIPKNDQFLMKVKDHNLQTGVRELLDDGLLKAIRGITSVDEVLRVCG